MTDTLTSIAQRSVKSAKIELFDVDAARLGGPTFHWINEAVEGGVSFGGVNYQSFPIKGSGWKKSGEGPLPQPKISVSNVTGLFSMLCALYDDLIGTKVTRTVTHLQFLDGQPDADPTQHYPPDVYFLAQKTSQDNEAVTWSMASSLDLRGRQIPGRLITQNTCMHRYRYRKDGAWVYGSCPYAGSAYFDRNTNPVGLPEQDVCGKRLRDCRRRFGDSQDLPMWAFPGADRFNSRS